MNPETLLTLALVILFLPLIGFAIIIFSQQKLGKAAGILGTSILGMDLLLSIALAFTRLTTYAHEEMIQQNFEWFTLGNRSIELGWGIDNLTAIMLIVVTLISFLVHVFSTVYMEDDKRYPRFYAYLGLFTFSMLGIVIANNFLNMYIFWELVGISSYLLIGFWYEKDSASNASKKAFITNRIGDLGFLAGILIIFTSYGTFMFDEVFEQMSNGIIPFDDPTLFTAAGILIFCGAIGKSAQFPLQVWLPDAMEGPTPVSALIHAATMVAAGVYLTCRIFPMLTADAMTFVAYIGGITAFVAATVALTQVDFKRVLAFSTVSQLGYMVMAIGVGAYTSGFMHLITHAWFKACLFLASGSVIHAMHVSMHHAHNHSMDPQDINNMGGLRKTMPKTYIAFLIATLAISGVPLTSGFLSKDGILAGTIAFATLSDHWLLPVFGFGAAGMTAFYMFRLAIVSFHGKAKTEIAAHTKENSYRIVAPLFVLAFLSISFLYSFNPFNAGSGWFHDRVPAPQTVVPAKYQWDFMVPYATKEAHVHSASCNHGHAGHNHTTDHAEHKPAEPAVADQSEAHGEHHAVNKFEEELHEAHMPAMILSLIMAGLGIFLAFVFYQFKAFNLDGLVKALKPAYNLSFNKWYFDEIYDKTVIGGTMFLSKTLSWIDLKLVDGIVNATGWVVNIIAIMVTYFDDRAVDGTVNLTSHLVRFSGFVLRKSQTGKVQAYIILALIGLMVLFYSVL